MNSVLQAFVHAPGKKNENVFYLQIKLLFSVLRDCFLSEKGQCQLNDNTNHIFNNCIMCQLRQLYHHVNRFVFVKRSN